uniref:TATA box-binding protein-associated factor RNA polymerase I subunit B n=1 Tax=Heliothis virescens TaxID=7102 RepID=A0A2A4JE75_HELVI
MRGEPCGVCSGTDLELKDGFYYCMECGTQNTDVRETVVEDKALGNGTFAIGTRRKILIKDNETQMSGEWYKWHAYNFIISGLADELVAAGAKPSFKLKLLWIWTRYIKKYQNKEDMGLAKKPADGIEENMTLPSFMMEENSTSNPVPDEEMEQDQDEGAKKSVKKNVIVEGSKRDIKFLSKGVIMAMLYLALNLDESDIQLSHIIRFIKEKHLNFSNITRFLPKDINVKTIQGLWTSFINSKVCNMHTVRKLAMSLLRKLDLGTPKVPNLRKIVDNILAELCLPNDMKPLIYALMHFNRCDFMDMSNKTKDHLVKLPDYEGVVMSYVLVAMKMCFGLDGVYEEKLSDAVENINNDRNLPKSHKIGKYSEPSTRLFSFREWCSYMQFRKMTLCQSCLNMAEQHCLDIDDYVYMEHVGEMPHNNKDLQDETAIDIINRIPTEDEGRVIPKHLFFPSLTPMSDYTEIVMDHSQDPGKLSEDFTQYSLKYACEHLELVDTAENIIKGVSEDGKITSELILGTIVQKKSKTEMIYVKNCENKNWMTTKPPKMEHVLCEEQNTSDDRESDQNTSNDRVSDQNTSNDRVSDQNTSHDRVSDQNTSHDRESDQNTSNNKESDHNTSYDKESHHNTSNDKESHQNISDEKESDRNMSVENESDQNVINDKETDQNISNMKETDPNTSEEKEGDHNIISDTETDQTISKGKETDQNISNSKETDQNVSNNKETDQSISNSKETDQNFSSGRETDQNMSNDKDSDHGYDSEHPTSEKEKAVTQDIQITFEEVDENDQPVKEEDPDQHVKEDDPDQHVKEDERPVIIKEENKDINIFDDTFLELDIKDEIELEQFEDLNNEEQTWQNNHTIQEDRASISDASDVGFETTPFNPDTFDREQTIKELILNACKKYKIPVPPEYKTKEKVPRKRKTDVFGNEDGPSVPRKRNKTNKNKVDELLSNYYTQMQSDLMTKMQNDVNLAIQNTRLDSILNPAQNESANPIIDPASDAASVRSSIITGNTENLSTVDPQSSVIQQNDKEQNPDETIPEETEVIDEEFESKLFENDEQMEIDDLIKKSDPKFDDKKYDTQQLYIKIKEEDDICEDDLFDLSTNPELEKIISKKIEQNKDRAEFENLKAERKIVVKTKYESDSDDEMPLKAVQEEKKKIEEMLEWEENFEPLINKEDLPEFKYWLRHYDKDFMTRSQDWHKKFDEELKQNTPSSFFFVIGECAAILSSSTFTLYKHMQNLESYILARAK